MASKNETKIIAEPGKQELFIIREFDAPRELVFRAHVDPKLYTRWLGPRGHSMELEKFEPKDGGSFRYVHKDPSGNKFSFHGVYHEVMAPERLIGTFEFEGLPDKGHVELDTARFESLPGGRSKLTIQAVYQSVQDRDGMISSGMEKGVKDGMARLDELLESLK
jgi:uncharacterized protein YndB with AHSA1/START domain